MRRFTSIFVKRDKNSDLSSSSSSTNSDHSPIPSWKSWIGAKRSSQKRLMLLQPVHHDIDEDSQSEEEEEEEEDDEDEEEEYDQNNIRTHIQNALVVPVQSNSPFVHHPDQPIFPRSSNNRSVLKPQSSTRISMFNSHLLARLNSTVPLSPSELSSILPFASRSAPIAQPSIPSSDFSRLQDPSHISSASLGIHRWITRPSFEDRFVVYFPTDVGIHCRPVTSNMAIAALEYPEYLDVMVDPDFDLPPKNVFYHAPPADPSQAPYAVPFIQSHGTPPETTVTPVNCRNSPIPVPSPLRIQHGPPTTAPAKKDMPLLDTQAPKATVKRVVRFADDDEEDAIPLHMVRMKKKREEKAKFLRLEQIKRAKEEEIERKLQEQEALERERKILAKEKEKREIDKAIYADAIVATRLRRESHRAGTILPSNTTNSLPPPSFTSLRNSERNKPPMDSRKLASKLSFDSTPSLSIPRRDNSDSSPGSSRPPSIGHSPVSSSMYSTQTSSSEEVRQQRGSRRNSVATASVSGGPSSYYPPLYASWSGNSQTIPHVPPLPAFVPDMPLLPPTAPFMKGSSYNRRSKSPASSSTSRRDSLISSQESVIQYLPPQTTRPTPSRHHSTTAVPRTEKRPTFERQSSSDSRTLSTHSTQQQRRPTPTSSLSQPTLSRGRPALPSSPLYLPSPWTALPSQNALIPPTAYSPMNAYPASTGPMQTVQLGSGGGGRMGGNSNGRRESLIS